MNVKHTDAEKLAGETHIAFTPLKPDDDAPHTSTAQFGSPIPIPTPESKVNTPMADTPAYSQLATHELSSKKIQSDVTDAKKSPTMASAIKPASSDSERNNRTHLEDDSESEDEDSDSDSEAGKKPAKSAPTASAPREKTPVDAPPSKPFCFCFGGSKAVKYEV